MWQGTPPILGLKDGVHAVVEVLGFDDRLAEQDGLAFLETDGLRNQPVEIKSFPN